MKLTISRSYALVATILVVVALAAESWLQLAPEFFAWRRPLINFSGVLAIGVMSLAVLLAARPRFLENRLDGLDKMYRLHKWLGITALVVSVIHWLLVKAPKWLIEAGWMTRPQRRPRPPITDPLEAWLRTQRHLAESVGEWAFYVAAALMVLALIKWFPYRWFFQTHRIIPLAFLALVFHTLILVPLSYWTQPVGWVLIVLLVPGTWGALLSVLQCIGRQRRHDASVLELTELPAMDSLRVVLKVQGAWNGHRAGQFVFLTADGWEGAHPFTMASASQADGRITFYIKALGDYTRTLAQRLQVGQKVKIEGPYGRFDFDDVQPQQIWVAGGIGITPFMARLEWLATRAPVVGGQTVDLIYATRAVDESLMGRLQHLAEAAGVRLHLLVESRDGRLSTEGLCQRVPGWREASVWFCGPAGFGRMLRRSLCGQGLPAARFHQELFEMR